MMEENNKNLIELLQSALLFESEGRSLYGESSVASFHRQWLAFRCSVIVGKFQSNTWSSKESISLAKKLLRSFVIENKKYGSGNPCKEKNELIPMMPIFPHNHDLYKELAKREHIKTINILKAASILKSFPSEYLFIVDVNGDVLTHPSEIDQEKSFLRMGRKCGRIIHPALSNPQDLKVLGAGEISFFRFEKTILFFMISISGHYLPKHVTSAALANYFFNSASNLPVELICLANDGLTINNEFFYVDSNEN